MHVVEYIYKGKKFEDRIYGAESEIRARLFNEDKTIINIKKQSKLFQRKPSQAEIIATFTAIGNQMAAQVRLIDAITSVIQSFKKDSPMIPILSNVKTNIINGKHLSKSLEEYAYIFGVEPITMISTGEETGKLPETLITVANHIKKSAEIRGKMVKSLMQPLLTLGVALVSLFISSTFVIPKLTKSLSGMGGKKADGAIFLTILNNISWGMPVVIATLTITVAILITLYKFNQEKAEQIIAKIPILREMVFYKAYYITFSSLANMLGVGVRLQHALPIVSNSIKIITIKKELDKASDLIRNGRFRDFATAFKAIDAVERQMLQTATDEDIIQDNFQQVSSRFYDLYINKFETLGPIIKYAVMVFVLVLVVFMFLGIMLPYISMMEHPTQ